MERLSSYEVIIPSYKRPDMLLRAVESVFAQTHLPAHVYVIIDEPENLQTYAFLTQWAGRLSFTFTGGGLGGSGARNVGLDQVKGDYIFFLDDDDEWLPQKVEKQVKTLDTFTDAVAVTCGRQALHYAKKGALIRIPDEGLLNQLIRVENQTGSFTQFGFSRKRSSPDIRLDAGLPSSQDFDFYIRLADYGSTKVVPEVLMTYHIHAGDRISNNLKRKLEARIYLFEKYRARLSAAEIREWKREIRKYEVLSTPSGLKAAWLFLPYFWSAVSTMTPPKSIWVTLRIAIGQHIRKGQTV